MFAEPLSVTVNAVAQSLPRIDNPGGKAIYRKDDGSYLLTTSHVLGANRNRFTLRLDNTKLTTDPFVSANNVRVGCSAIVIMDMPVLGYTTTEMKDITLGLTSWATSVRLLQMLGGEL